MESNEAVAAIRQNILHSSGQLAFTKAELCTDTAFFARTGQAFPYPIPFVGEKHQLNRIAGILTDTQQAGRDNTGIVQYQRITRMQILRQLIKMPVRNITGSLV